MFDVVQSPSDIDSMKEAAGGVLRRRCDEGTKPVGSPALPGNYEPLRRGARWRKNLCRHFGEESNAFHWRFNSRTFLLPYGTFLPPLCQLATWNVCDLRKSAQVNDRSWLHFHDCREDVLHHGFIGSDEDARVAGGYEKNHRRRFVVEESVHCI